MVFEWLRGGRRSESFARSGEEMVISGVHAVLGTPMVPPFPEGYREIVFGMGCFWGAERFFWNIPGVYTTSVGYAGGEIDHPSYEDVCRGMTGHAEVVRVVFDPEKITPETLLSGFWQAHDPTQGMRQGNDRGTQYRSVIYVDAEDLLEFAQTTKSVYQKAIGATGRSLPITTEILMNVPFYYAEEYHQQYLAKNPNGYCGLKGLGVDYVCAGDFSQT
mgnify:CR=1 FL=1